MGDRDTQQVDEGTLPGILSMQPILVRRLELSRYKGNLLGPERDSCPLLRGAADSEAQRDHARYPATGTTPPPTG